MDHPLVDFISGFGGDHRGRTLSDILNWSDIQMENSHDFIQWLFPLPEQSNAVPFAPVMDSDTEIAIKKCPSCRIGLVQATVRMMFFYGIPFTCDRIATFRNNTHIEACFSYRNHNFLRMTRILRSLSLLGMQDEARKILDFIEKEIYPKHQDVLEEAMVFWREAVKGEKNWPPAHLSQ